MLLHLGCCSVVAVLVLQHAHIKSETIPDKKIIFFIYHYFKSYDTKIYRPHLKIITFDLETVYFFYLL